MKRNQIKCRWPLVLLVIGFMGLVAVPRSLFALEDAIIAVVNDEIITLRDLRDYIRSTYVSLMAEGIPEREIREIMLDLETNGLNKLIEDKIMLTHANEIGLDIREGLLDERLEEVKSKYKTEQEFMDALVQHGVTISDLRNKILEQTKIKFVIEHEVRAKIYVTPKEITKYYQENAEKFEKKENLRLDSIFVSFDKGKTEGLERARQALLQIQEGGVFRDVAKKYSDTPAIGQVERGQLQPAIEEAVFKLAVGDVSDLIEVNNGIYILQTLEHTRSEVAQLDEVKDKIQGFLFRQKFEKEFHIWLKKLKDKAYIEIKK